MLIVLKSFFSYLLGLVRLNKTIRYHGEQKTLIGMMDQLAEGNTLDRGLLCKKVSDQLYVFSHREFEPIEFELELWALQPHFTAEVRVEVQLVQQMDQLQLLQCSGRLRVIHFIIFFFYASIIGIKLNNKDGISLNSWMLLTVLFIIVHVIANHFWSSKEQYVVEALKKALRTQMKF